MLIEINARPNSWTSMKHAAVDAVSQSPLGSAGGHEVVTETSGNGQSPAKQQVLHLLERIAVAEDPFAVLKAIQDYMLAWPKERVANLQKMDGGWAPFDRERNPLPVNTLGHLALFQEEVHRQCLALSRENMQLTPELAELDEMLTIANRFIKAVGTPDFKELSAKLSKRTAMLRRL